MTKASADGTFGTIITDEGNTQKADEDAVELEDEVEDDEDWEDEEEDEVDEDEDDE